MYDTLVYKKVLSFAFKLLIYKTKHKHKQSNIETLGLGCELYHSSLRRILPMKTITFSFHYEVSKLI